MSSNNDVDPSRQSPQIQPVVTDASHDHHDGHDTHDHQDTHAHNDHDVHHDRCGGGGEGSGPSYGAGEGSAPSYSAEDKDHQAHYGEGSGDHGSSEGQGEAGQGEEFDPPSAGVKRKRDVEASERGYNDRKDRDNERGSYNDRASERGNERGSYNENERSERGSYHDDREKERGSYNENERDRPSESTRRPQAIHRSSEGNYSDALLLASLSDEQGEQPQEKEGNDEKNKQRTIQPQPPTDRMFVLHPKPSPPPGTVTPKKIDSSVEHNVDIVPASTSSLTGSSEYLAKKKVTPDRREDSNSAVTAAATASQKHDHDAKSTIPGSNHAYAQHPRHPHNYYHPSDSPSRYHPGPNAPYYQHPPPPYYHHPYHPPMNHAPGYYPSGRPGPSSNMPNPPPPHAYDYKPPHAAAPVVSSPHHPSYPTSAPHSQHPAPSEVESTSPLPYHPLSKSHVVPTPSHHDQPPPPYDDWYGRRYEYDHRYYPHPTSSPARTQPYTVSMDENSPRVDYAHPSHPHPTHPPAHEKNPAATSSVNPATPTRYGDYPPHTPHTPSHATPSRNDPPPPPPSGGYYQDPYYYDAYYSGEYTPPPHYDYPNPEHGHPSATHGQQSAAGAAAAENEAIAMNEAKKHQFRKGARGMHSEPVLLRKKFSWRNYPELEEYLIANRTEYLHHSALNYTAEQKHFNNRLTEGLLELAAKHNYIFDESCFNFVAVRDRIRCYYKSYVQSSKKRGIVVGFPKRDRKSEGGKSG